MEAWIRRWPRKGEEEKALAAKEGLKEPGTPIVEAQPDSASAERFVEVARQLDGVIQEQQAQIALII